jgi:hypothetical protein
MDLSPSSDKNSQLFWAFYLQPSLSPQTICDRRYGIEIRMDRNHLRDYSPNYRNIVLNFIPSELHLSTENRDIPYCSTLRTSRSNINSAKRGSCSTHERWCRTLISGAIGWPTPLIRTARFSSKPSPLVTYYLPILLVWRQFQSHQELTASFILSSC